MDHARASHSQRATRRLHPISCINCRSRKVKCDKIQPCTPCRRIEAECLFRAKKSRPRKAHSTLKARTTEIASRLDRLDALVARLGGAGADSEGPDGGERRVRQHPDAIPGDPSPPHLSGSSDLELGLQVVGRKTEKGPTVGSDFWLNLETEVDGLRQLLAQFPNDDEESDEDEDARPGGLPSPGLRGNAPVVFPFDRLRPGEGGFVYPAPSDALKLVKIFFDRVNAMFRIVHEPTTQAMVVSLAENRENQGLTKGEEALLWSMFYAAATSMDDEMCRQELNQERSVLLLRYKAATEQALTEAELLNTTDYVVLQAFVLYLIVLRVIDSTRTQWSLVGLAIRLAQALDLHRDESYAGNSPYDVQLKRILWYTLTLMNIQAFHDRALSPMFLEYAAQPSLPANVNDADFGPHTRGPLLSRDGFADCSVPLMSFAAAGVAQRIAAETASTGDIASAQDYLRQMQSSFEPYIQHFDPRNPIAWFGANNVRIAILKLWLMSYIPVHARPPATSSKATKVDILAAAVVIMEQHIAAEDKAELRGWQWYHALWHQMHPLAVALAQLASSPTLPLADRAWSIIRLAMARWAHMVADGTKGNIWRPIRKLLDRARAARIHALTSSGQPLCTESSDPMGVPLVATFVLTDEMRQLHDAALRRALGLRKGQDSAILHFRSPDSKASSSSSGADQLDARLAGIEDPINWEEWDAFIQGMDVDTGTNADALDLAMPL